MSRTRYEWTLFDFALWAVGAQPVPVYPTSSVEQVHWILYDSSCVGCVVEDEDQAMTVGSVIERLPQLRRLWQLDAGAVADLVESGRGVAEGWCTAIAVRSPRIRRPPSSTPPAPRAAPRAVCSRTAISCSRRTRW
ncbi:hypothetical protein GCM10020254_20490 [Streptomyces goshikiensis]